MTAFLPVASNLDLNARVYDNLYQTSSNMLESASRVLNARSTKISLNDKAFGNVVNARLPHGNLLLSHTSLTLKIAGDFPEKAYLMQDWIYDAIRYVEFQFGNSEKLRYEGKHLFIKNMADAESGEKKEIMQQVAGRVKKTFAHSQPGNTYDASVTLYLPFSNMASSRVLPFDSSILDSPVEISIELAPADQVFKYTAADAAVVRAGLPAQYADAYVSCKTQYMVDGSSDSIRDVVSMRGNEKYTYAYIYPQCFMDSRDIDGIPASVEISGCSVDLTRFLNASLQSIDVFVQRLTLGNPAGSPVGSLANARLNRGIGANNLYVPLSNVQLTYAGQPIYRSDDTSNILENLSEYPTSTTFNINTVNFTESAQTGGALQDARFKGYWTHIQLSQFNERYFTNLNQTGVAMNSNEVQLRFNTPETESLETLGIPNLDTSPTAPAIKYRVFAIYNYIAGVRTAKSSTSLVFQPPLASLPSISGIQGTF